MKENKIIDMKEVVFHILNATMVEIDELKERVDISDYFEYEPEWPRIGKLGQPSDGFPSRVFQLPPTTGSPHL